MVKLFIKRANEKGDDDDDDDETKFMKKKAKTQKHEFLRFIVETAMERERMDININTNDPIHKKIMKKVDVWRKGSDPILVEDPLQSKKPPLMEKEEANFKEVVDVEEGKVVLVSKDVNDDHDYEKEVMNKKTTKKASENKKNNNKGKNTCKLPVEPPNEKICKLMLKRISEIQGLEPIWLCSKILTISDQDPGLGRFYIPKCVELVEYLRKDELDIIDPGLHCKLVDQNGEMWDLRLRYYDYIHQYAFVSGWKNLLKSFGLLKASKNAPKEDVPEIPDGKIDLWCFRLPDKHLSLGFGLWITTL